MLTLKSILLFMPAAFLVLLGCQAPAGHHRKPGAVRTYHSCAVVCSALSALWWPLIPQEEHRHPVSGPQGPALFRPPSSQTIFCFLPSTSITQICFAVFLLGMLVPQGLCTSSSTCHPLPPHINMAHWSTSSRALFKGHLLRKALLDHPTEYISSLSPPTPPPRLSSACKGGPAVS